MYNENQVLSKTLDYFNQDELAANVFINKYCLRDREGSFLEESPDDMHKRLASEFFRIENKFGGSNSLSEKEIYSLFKNFKYVVPQGSPMCGIGNNNVAMSLSNCVVVDSPMDDISSIMNAGKDLANLFKRRCGVGIDISTLRPDGMFVNNSARTTTGAWSFADLYSYICRMIGQNGRRGALMISMDVRHPDIENFIKMKGDLSKVTGANVSIKITDDFMKAVKNETYYTQEWPIGSLEPQMEIRKPAVDIWEQIVKSATETAEPGVLMWDNIIKYLPASSYKMFIPITTNPCGEIPLSPYDSCRLISVNLKHLVKDPFTSSSKFDFSKLQKISRAATRLSDNLVELELEKLSNIINVCDTSDEKELWEKLYNAASHGRRIGLGTHGLADCLSKMCLRYDSDGAISLIEKIYKTIRDSSYGESTILAEERGAFPVFNWELEKDNLFIKKLPKNIRDRIEKVGRRNIALLTNAPTGSVSILSQTSSGIEPVFKNSYIRRRKINHNEEVSADFIDDLGDKWVEYFVHHHNLRDWCNKAGISEDTLSDDDIPDYFVESDQINWNKRIMVQAAIQSNIDHSISSTINLPKGTSSDVVGELYLKGWELGLKGITVYVDGSRSGVLVSKKSKKAELFPTNEAPKRMETLDCDIHRLTVKGEKWTIFVSLYENKPYEIMGGLSNFIEIPNKIYNGRVTKVPMKSRASRYDLVVGDSEDALKIRDINKVFDNPNNEVLTRLVSLGLRHGTNVSHIVEQLKKDKDSDMFSFNKCLARVLKKYIPDGTQASSEHCPGCSSKKLIYQDGCVQCQDCGWSGCS